MDELVLIDKEIFPTEDIIFSHIGKTKTYWIALFEYLQSVHPDLTDEWRYYKDGKSWLLKVTKKSKTVFWLSVNKNLFNLAFYFGGKAQQTLLESDISDDLRKLIVDAKKHGKINGITLPMNKKKNLGLAKELIELKKKIK